MRSILRAADASRPAAALMVWLPGAFHSPEDFLRAGFDAAVRERGLRVDLLFVDLELKHLDDRACIAKLHDDVVQPARAAGCRSLWMAGISLGGFIALAYAALHPAEWEGLCLLAPYLGNRLLTAEIARAPGLAAWQPGELAAMDEERRIWQFIGTPRLSTPPIYLGYGRADRFAQAHELMAAALPAGAVDLVDGGHDWTTWSLLWRNFLDAQII